MSCAVALRNHTNKEISFKRGDKSTYCSQLAVPVFQWWPEDCISFLDAVR